MILPTTNSLQITDRLLSRDIPLVLGVFLLWKFLKKTEVVSLTKIPLQDALEQVDER